MQIKSWWEPAPNSLGLSQGDVVNRIPFCSASAPVTPLKWTQLRGGGNAWAEVDTPILRNQRKQFLAYGDYFPGLVISHSCELDNQNRSGKVLLAPIAPISSLAESMRITVVDQRHLALMPLPDMPVLGTSYADLRLITAVSRELVLDAERLASMTPNAIDRLYAQVFKFVMRKELPLPIPPT